VILQGDTFNRSKIATVVVVPLTSNTRLAAMPGNILLASSNTGLPKDSVANVTQIITIDRSLLTDRIGSISRRHLELLWNGIDVLFDR
jgi:mRNA interferase MazF